MLQKILTASARGRSASPQRIIKCYFQDKVFGFIRSDEGGADSFFHIPVVQRRGLADDAIPDVDHPIEFEIAIEGRSGRYCAQHIRLL
jgi:cold shock CspA family protein